MRRPVEVLAVGDSASVLAEVRAAVDPLGARVREAAGGEEALRSLLREPDAAAIVMALRLPGMDGLATAAAIRRRHKTRHVPVLVMADDESSEGSAAAYAAGVADYLTTPVDRAELRAKLAVFIDLHLRRRVETPIDSSMSDGVTGLPSRELFGDRLTQALARARRRPRPLAVLLVDLAGVGRINHAHGRDAADAVLVEAGRRLRGLLRGDDTVARHRDAEFTVLAEDVADAGAARELGERIADELARPYAGGLELDAAVGVAYTANAAGTTPDGLIRRADHAMCRTRRGARRTEVTRVRPGLLPATGR